MSVESSLLSLPETIVGSYRVHHVIAEGDVATIHEAAHLTLPRRAAVKLLRPEVVASPEAAQRVTREAAVLEAFGHPGIVRVFDSGVLADGRTWLAMELVGGEPLSAMFARVGPMPVAEVVELTTGLVEILAAAHRSGIVHRDLGPPHVLVGGGGCHGVRILGWGLARQPGRAANLVTDRRADVYAVAALAFQAAVGRPPFVAVPPVARVISQFHAPPASVRSLRPELPPGFAALVDAMLASDPAARPSAGEVADQLARQAALDAYDDYALQAEERAQTAAERALTSPLSVKAEADRDWEQLMALDVVRRRWSSPAAAGRRGKGPLDDGKPNRCK